MGKSIAYREKSKVKLNSNVKSVLFYLAFGIVIACIPLIKLFSGLMTAVDEGVFLYIGKQMHNGFLPYRDIFDHKGIYFYFVQWFGYCITPNSVWGTWVLCVAIFVISVWRCNELLKKITESKTIQNLTFSCFGFLTALWLVFSDNFDMTETLSLPWIFYLMEVFAEFLKEKEINKKKIFEVGIGFAVVCLIRANIAVVWGAVGVAVICELIASKKWKDIRKCAVYFLSGTAIALVPAAIYFAITGTFGDMIECYVKFNGMYSTASMKQSMEAFLYLTENCLLIICGIIPVLFIRKRIYSWNIPIYLFYVGFMSMSGNQFGHYKISLLPLAAIIVAGILEVVRKYTIKYNTSKHIYRFTRILKKMYLVFPVIFYLYFGLCAVASVSSGVTRVVESKNIIDWMNDNTYKEDDVQLMGNKVTGLLYSDRSTKCRYVFTYPVIFYGDYEEKVTDAIIGQKSDYYIFETGYLSDERDYHPYEKYYEWQDYCKKIADILDNSGKYEKEDIVFETTGSWTVYKKTGE